MAEPHLIEREVVRSVPDRFLGELKVTGFPLRFSDYPRHPAMEAPTLGEHNADVLQGLLGLSADRVKELETKGVIARGPR